MPDAMNSRERILAAIDHKPIDRIPLDIWATPEVFEQLHAHFGEGVDILDALHIDGFAGIGATYAGPALPSCSEGESVDYWGVRSKSIQYGTGEYSECSYHPLADAESIDDLNAYPWPQADWFDYSGMAEDGRRKREHRAVQCGYMAPFYFHNKLRGLEQSLIDPLEDPEFTHELIHRISDFFLQHHRRMFEAAEGTIDVAQVTDDLGSQHGPLMGLELWREFYKPHVGKMIDLCKEFGIKVFHHDDGACRDFLPDLVEMGIDILNPIQWTCPNMEMESLKAEFGARICFHGAVENQKIIPFGSADEVRAEVRHCIDALATDGTGYILAPCHNLQPITPLENILALYDEAHLYGKL